MRKSFLEESPKKSPLRDSSVLQPGGKRNSLFRKDLAMALPLTSLIDAFSIIVIYLLIGTQNSGMETQVPTQLTLPLAHQSQSVEKLFPILRIQQGQYFLDNQKISANDLTARLMDLKKKSQEKDIELMIQADTNMKYAELDPLMKAGSLAGIEKLKFAVVPGR